LRLLLEGIVVNNDKIIFDFRRDDPETDIISLKFGKFNKKISTRSGTDVYFGYRYAKNAPPADIALVRTAIKMMDTSLIAETDINLLIQKAVNNFLNVSGETFDIIITPKSSGPLVTAIAKAFKAKLGVNTLLATDSIVKNSIDNIKIDPAKASAMSAEQRSNLNRIIAGATKTGSFKMKSVPIPMRRSIINFFKFDDSNSRQVFNKISSGKVLLLDDIYTGGSTFTEMVRIISEQSPSKITGFILLLSN